MTNKSVGGKIVDLQTLIKKSSPTNFKEMYKMARRKDNGSLTGSKRYKEEKAKSAGSRAKKVAESAGATLKDVATNTGKTAAKAGVSVATNGAKNAGQAVANSTQGVMSALSGEGGYKRGFASGQLSREIDAYGGLAFPEQDFTGMMPTDMLNPAIELQVSEEQLTQGLEVYAGATRAQQLLQAGYTYIGEVGKTKQKYHKGQQSVIKAATEGVKVEQEIVNYDIANIQLDQKLEKREQEDEKLKQEQLKTIGTRNETEQVRQKIEVQEQKRDAEIQSILSQTQNIIQKYHKGAISPQAVA